MPDNSEYLGRLADSIRQLYGCKAVHVESITAREMFRGRKMWEKDVEKFELKKNPKAKFVYAWGTKNSNDPNKMEVTTVLEVPPVDSAIGAVRMAIAAENKLLH